MKLSENLRRYIDAGFPILYVSSFEEGEVDRAIRDAADSSGTIGKIFEWNYVNKFAYFDTKNSFDMRDESLTGTLHYLLNETYKNKIILVLKDISSLIGEPEVKALLKKIAENISAGLMSCTIIIESIVRNIPKELEPYITVLEAEYMGTNEIRELVRAFMKENLLDNQIPEDLLDEMSVAFKGLSKFEIENILALACQESGEFTRKDLKLIFAQKQQIILKSGLLEMIPLPEKENEEEKLESIGGLNNLKNWLRRKAKILKNIDKSSDFGVDIPKGVLIAGMPGCGKSLSAKAAANLFEVPLLRLDMGRLMGKYVGESEANLRGAIRLAEAISPCVLWIDELEKAFAGVGGTGSSDITTRLFGNFLTWMQEKDNPVFVVATANDITKLPPELMRKGRFDEIFYVGLPAQEERKSIFDIHIRKRREQDIHTIDLDKLAEKSKGYSGADIEGVIKEGIEMAYCEERSMLRTEDILNVMKDTHPLSELLKEDIEKMEKIYKDMHFRNASTSQVEKRAKK